jgi:cytochrome P450
MRTSGVHVAQLTESSLLEVDRDFGYDDLGEMAPLLAEMRAAGPASWVRFIGERALHLNTYELVQAAFRDETAIPGERYYSLTQQPVMGRTVQSMPGGGEEHKVARALQSPFFRQRLMPGYVQPIFDPIANDLIDAFIDDGEADLVPQFTKLYPMRVIMRILDLPEIPGVDWPYLAWQMIQYTYDLEASKQAIATFDVHVGPLIEERKSKPGEDLISALVTTEVDGEKMDDAAIYAFARLMFPAGSDTTYLGLGCTLTALFNHPDAMEQVRQDPSEARWAIEEGMRWRAGVAHLTRRTTDDIEWHGLSIPADTVVLPSVQAANHDPAVFSDPDQFILSRHPQNVLTFGFAAHYCLGVHFARAEMEVALNTLLARLPNLRMQDGQPLPEVRGALLRGPESLKVTWG